MGATRLIRATSLKLIGGKRTESPWLHVIAGVLLIAGPLWHELFTNRYPLRPEVLVLLLVAAALGAAIASGSRLVGGLTGAVVFGGLLFLFVDLQFDLHREIRTIYLLAGSLLVSVVISTHRAAITSLALGAFYLSSLVRPAPATATESAGTGNRSTRPLLLHVILDEQWGVGGLEAAGDTVTANFLASFYLDRGFELYESAYSRYEMTRESIPAVLSLGEPPEFSPDSTRNGMRYFWRMSDVPYFRKLREMGYAIRVHESTYLDVCGDSTLTVKSCDVFWGNSIANIGVIDGNWTTRGQWVARYYLQTRSHVIRRFLPEESVWNRSVAGGAVESLRRLTSAVESGPSSGVAYFAHVLLPHRPVHVDQECRVLEDPSSMIGYDLPPNLDDAQWQAAVRAFAGQVRCAHRLLGDLLDAVDRVAGPGNSIVIVHGDHGSRMHRRTPPEEQPEIYDADQLNSAFPTLLAIRLPGTTPSLEREPVPVQDFLHELARSQFGESPKGRPWQHELRGAADGSKRALALKDMPWAR